MSRPYSRPLSIPSYTHSIRVPTRVTSTLDCVLNAQTTSAPDLRPYLSVSHTENIRAHTIFCCSARPIPKHPYPKRAYVRVRAYLILRASVHSMFTMCTPWSPSGSHAPHAQSILVDTAVNFMLLCTTCPKYPSPQATNVHAQAQEDPIPRASMSIPYPSNPCPHHDYIRARAYPTPRVSM